MEFSYRKYPWLDEALVFRQSDGVSDKVINKSEAKLQSAGLGQNEKGFNPQLMPEFLWVCVFCVNTRDLSLAGVQG